jgi:hypothetical protein
LTLELVFGDPRSGQWPEFSPSSGYFFLPSTTGAGSGVSGFKISLSKSGFVSSRS